MEYGIIKGICWYRIFAAAWAVLIVYLSREKLLYPTYAVMICFTIVIIAIVFQQISYREPALLMKTEVIIGDLIFAAAITMFGGFIYEPGSSSSTLALASQYILASVLMAGVTFGLVGGILAGLVVGLSRLFASIINETPITTSHVLSLVSTTVTFCLSGALVGGIVSIIRRTGGELSEVRARDKIARTLHDGVLQTLLIIEKRSKEPEIVELASRQERELRSFLFAHQSQNSEGSQDLYKIFDDITKEFTEKTDFDISLVIAPDVGNLSRHAIKSISGATKECLTNILKHAEAHLVTIFIEPDEDSCVVSIRDDGKGFDVDKVIHGEEKEAHQGIRSSIVTRIEELGGKVNIKSSPKIGTEIIMSIPNKAIEKL